VVNWISEICTEHGEILSDYAPGMRYKFLSTIRELSLEAAALKGEGSAPLRWRI